LVKSNLARKGQIFHGNFLPKIPLQTSGSLTLAKSTTKPSAKLPAIGKIFFLALTLRAIVTTKKN
jgi:hypothetical protein